MCPGAMPAIDQVGDAKGNDPRLAGSGAGQNQDRAVNRLHGLSLLRVERTQIEHRARSLGGGGVKASGLGAVQGAVHGARSPRPKVEIRESEARNPKSKSEIPKLRMARPQWQAEPDVPGLCFGFRPSAFFRVSTFGLRISGCRVGALALRDRAYAPGKTRRDSANSTDFLLPSEQARFAAVVSECNLWRCA